MNLTKKTGIFTLTLLSTLFLIPFLNIRIGITTASAQEYVHTHTLTGHTGNVRAIAFVDNDTLISGDWGTTLCAWNVNASRQWWDQDVGAGVTAVALPSHDPLFVAYGGHSIFGIRMRYTDNGNWRGRVEGHTDSVWSLAFQPESYLLASGSADNTIRIWNVGNQDNLRHVRILRGHTNTVYAVSWSPDGQTLASGSRDGTLRLWCPNNGVNFAVLRGHPEGISSLAWSPDGRTLVSGSENGTIRIWDLDTERTLHVLSGHTKRIASVAFHPNGALLASGSDDDTVRLWNPNTGSHKATLRGHTDWIGSVAFSPNGEIFASGSGDGTIRLWDTNTATPKIVFESQEIDDVGSGTFGWSKGNSNGVVEVGEQIAFTVTLRNTGKVDAKNVKGTLSTEDTSIESIIVDGEVDYDDIGVDKVSPAPLLDIDRSFKLKIPSILTSQDTTFTLTLTADNGGPWAISITISIVNPVSIGIEFPDNLISEEAFNERSIYFILTAEYAQLTGVSDAEVHYEDCTITLHIPQAYAAFHIPN